MNPIFNQVASQGRLGAVIRLVLYLFCAFGFRVDWERGILGCSPGMGFLLPSGLFHSD